MENTATPQPKFKRGDVVHLNSNPEIRMTVDGGTTPKVLCQRMLHDSICFFDIHEDCLTLVQS